MAINVLDAKKIRDLRVKYPDRVPILVTKATSTRQPIPDLDRCKFLVPHDYTMNSLLYVLRKRLPQLRPEQAIFLFIENRLFPANEVLFSVYEKYRSPDGLLRVTYALENTFG